MSIILKNILFKKIFFFFSEKKAFYLSKLSGDLID